jgi:hypothetical protein
MKEMKYKLPNDAESVTVKVEDGYVVALYEPKKELKFGDFVRLNKSANTGIIETVGNYGCLASVNEILFRAISEASEDEKKKYWAYWIKIILLLTMTKRRYEIKCVEKK